MSWRIASDVVTHFRAVGADAELLKIARELVERFPGLGTKHTEQSRPIGEEGRYGRAI